MLTFWELDEKINNTWMPAQLIKGYRKQVITYPTSISEVHQLSQFFVCLIKTKIVCYGIWAELALLSGAVTSWGILNAAFLPQSQTKQTAGSHYS